MRAITSTVFFCFLATSFSSFSDDWPQWLGPKRDSVWREQGIIKEIPKQGLSVKWRRPVGLGYSGPAVSGGKVYVLDYELRSGR
ncbi:MAG TPA: pyrrolo-quinoline quinone, partial [Verrucomicrobia bacterium]|nr:pyrrolo-quinoline quinone [Verrucomicrobiota bacterium]